MVRASIIVASVCLWAAIGATAAEPAAPKETATSIDGRTTGMRHLRGFLPMHWDAKKGHLYLEIARPGTELLYVESLPYGTGSNDLGLDRGQIGEPRVVRFDRVGARVLLVQTNQVFRTSAKDAAERLAVRQSFPESVLAGFAIEAEAPGGALLIDATEFFLHDIHDVQHALAKQGAYRLDEKRSAIAIDDSRSFPKNSEIEALLTFVSDAPLPENFVADVAPDAHALTVHEHHSFLELPGPGFTPRRFDARSGYFPLEYRDYAAPLGGALTQQFIVRHRLQKKDAGCSTACEAQKPIQYYVDRGAPEPVRSALVDGARWWDQAFQVAGWAPGTFRVDVLPEGADPMDARYNIIQWVHRYTRGWSYGNPVADPRTGEIIKGNVTLGSLRARQDYLIAEALLSPYTAGRTLTAQNDPMLAMSLARLRQLSAHETGHTLGLAHNFAASSVPHGPGESLSVMDYPHPWILLNEAGEVDLSQAYAANIGLWDKVAINFGYRAFADAGAERAGLESILGEAAKGGLYFISDDDSRSVASAHPHSSMWDNGPDPVAELTRIMKIRGVAIGRFGENAIPAGTPLAQLEDTFAPLYLLHRYQTEAALKVVGGLDYRFQLRGDGQAGNGVVPGEEQRKALRAVVATLSPEVLVIPEALLKVFPPRPPGLPRTRESLPASTGPTFDPIAAAESAADLTLSGLFEPHRAARLVEYAARSTGGLSLEEVIDAALAANRPTRREPAGRRGLFGEVQSAVYLRTVEALLSLAADHKSSALVRASVLAKLDELKQHVGADSPVEAYAVYRINQFLDDPTHFAVAEPVPAPPGMPIGEDGF